MATDDEICQPFQALLDAIAARSSSAIGSHVMSKCPQMSGFLPPCSTVNVSPGWTLLPEAMVCSLEIRVTHFARLGTARHVTRTCASTSFARSVYESARWDCARARLQSSAHVSAGDGDICVRAREGEGKGRQESVCVCVWRGNLYYDQRVGSEL